MASFFKNFGKGILYVLLLPVLLLGLAVYLLISLFMFLVLGIKGLILFFSGRSLYDDLPEDVEAKRRIQQAIINNNIEKNRDANINVDVNRVLLNKDNPLPLSNDPFYCPDYLKEDNSQLVEPNSDQFTEEPKALNNSIDTIEEEKTPITNFEELYARIGPWLDQYKEKWRFSNLKRDFIILSEDAPIQVMDAVAEFNQYHTDNDENHGFIEEPEEEKLILDRQVQDKEPEHEVILPKVEKQQENYEDEIMDDEEEEHSSGVDIFY